MVQQWRDIIEQNKTLINQNNILQQHFMHEDHTMHKTEEQRVLQPKQPASLSELQKLIIFQDELTSKLSVDEMEKLVNEIIADVSGQPISFDVVVKSALAKFVSIVKYKNLSIIFNDTQLTALINAQFQFFLTKVNEAFPVIEIKDYGSFFAFFNKWKHLLSASKRETVPKVSHSEIIIQKVQQSELQLVQNINTSKHNIVDTKIWPQRNDEIVNISQLHVNAHSSKISDTYKLTTNADSVGIDLPIYAKITTPKVRSSVFNYIEKTNEVSEGVVFKPQERRFIPSFPTRLHDYIKDNSSRISIRSNVTAGSSQNKNDNAASSKIRNGIQHSTNRVNTELGIVKDNSSLGSTRNNTIQAEPQTQIRKQHKKIKKSVEQSVSHKSYSPSFSYKSEPLLQLVATSAVFSE
ncbi:MAG: hypothetical protein LBD36_02185 [Holosporales bacterium]|jgi:hypothetical protein|nr:hypothetical protein [Holosporales bacterium]